MHRFAAGLIATSLLVGCSSPGEPTGDPYVPGDFLGAYRVTGTLRQSTCGPALGSPAAWGFDVQLSRADFELFWLNGREAISGRLAADGVSFAFETTVQVALEPDTNLGCSIARGDRASGRLSSPTLDVPTFSAALDYAYEAAPEADCSAYIADAGFARLPCVVSYELAGLRTRAPARK